MARFDLSKKAKVNRDIVWRKVNGDVIILNAVTSNYYALNAMSARIWEMIVARVSFEKIAARLVKEYDVTEKRLAADIRKLAGNLAKEKIITIV